MIMTGRALPRSPSLSKIRARITPDTFDGRRTCFQVTVRCEKGKKPLVARFGEIPLKRQRKAVITDRKPVMATARRNELIRRLLAGQCEMCEGRDGLQVHHIRKLADLNKPGRAERPSWVRLMAMRKRKALVFASVVIRTSTRDGVQHLLGNDYWRAVCGEISPERFGKGPSEKDPSHGHLVGGLLHSERAGE